MKTPRLTVVIPTCRRNDALARCLDKLVSGAQTLPEDQYEIVVSDDGAPENNARAMVEERYPAVRWVQGPRRGPAANRNSGASRRQCVVAGVHRRRLPAGAGMAGGLRGPHRRRCRWLPRVRGPYGMRRHGDRAVRAAPGNDTGGLLWSCNLAVERGLFESMGGFDAGFPYPHLEDVDFRLRLEDAREPHQFVREACILHPPRPIGSALSWARAQESSFYLARKRGVPLAAVNFGFGTYARLCVRSLRASRNLWESVRLAWRIVEEVALMCFYLPRFAWKYGSVGR